MEISDEDFWSREHLQTVNISKIFPVPTANAENHDAKYSLQLLLLVIFDALLITSFTDLSVWHYRIGLLLQVVTYQR
jgi:hypothetical protein